MNNPYQSPESEPSNPQNSEVVPTKWPKLLLLLISILGLVSYSFAAFMLISPALLASRNRIVWGWLAVGISAIAFVLVAIIFQPM